MIICVLDIDARVLDTLQCRLFVTHTHKEYCIPFIDVAGSLHVNIMIKNHVRNLSFKHLYIYI